MDKTVNGHESMRMKKKIEISLEKIDWGQIIDGLTCRAEQYEQMADYYSGGQAKGDVLLVRDGDEARGLADWYREIISKIHAQINL